MSRSPSTFNQYLRNRSPIVTVAPQSVAECFQAHEKKLAQRDQRNAQMTSEILYWRSNLQLSYKDIDHRMSVVYGPVL